MAKNVVYRWICERTIPPPLWGTSLYTREADFLFPGSL